MTYYNDKIIEGEKKSLKSFLITNNIVFAWSHSTSFQYISFAVEVLLEARYTLFIFLVLSEVSF